MIVLKDDKSSVDRRLPDGYDWLYFLESSLLDKALDAAFRLEKIQPDECPSLQSALNEYMTLYDHVRRLRECVEDGEVDV